MITGHILAKVVIGFIWAMAVAHSWLLLIIAITLITLFISLEILIAYLQAYIFTFITCLTLKDIVSLAEEVLYDLAILWLEIRATICYGFLIGYLYRSIYY